MGQEIWRPVLDLVQRRGWPNDRSTAAPDQAGYEAALDAVNGYRGDPSLFLDVLPKFQSCGAAYANAGIGAVLMHAAYERGDDYDQKGLQAAEPYLQKARQLLAHRAEIEHLAAKLFVLRKQPHEARRLLDELHRAHPENYWISAVEIWYWCSRQDLAQAEQWCKKAQALADNPARRYFVARKMANAHQSRGDKKKALAAQRELLELDPNDAWAWHNLSILLLDAGKLDEAEAANASALAIMDFPAARQMTESIRRYRNPVWRWLAGLFTSS